MFRYLGRIKEDLEHQLKNKQLLPRNADQLLSLLIHLPPIEKNYLRLYFRASAWNIGSPNVIILLQRAHILSMTEYISHQKSSNNNESYLQEIGLPHEQLIFDDLLESDLRLLANLIQCMGDNTEQGICVKEILIEGIARMFIDLFQQSNVVVNYLRHVSAHISKSQLEAFRLLHVEFLVNYNKITVNEAIGLQSKWNSQFNVDCKDPSTLNQLVLELCTDRTAFTLLKLLDMSREPDFTGWLWYLRLIRTIVSGCEETNLALVRQFLRNSFKAFLQQCSDKALYAILIVHAYTYTYAYTY